MQIDFITAVDLSTTPYFTFKLYTPSSIQILAKLEGGSELEVWSDFSLVDTLARI